MKLLLPIIGGAFSATIPIGTAPMQPINSNFMNPNFRPIQNFINPRPVQIMEEIVQQPILRPQSPNMFGGMDPMMMMMLMSDDDSSMKDLLPLMMMQGGAGGMFGGGGQNGMNPLLMMTLLDDDEACEVNSNVKQFTELTSDQQKSIARGDYIYIGEDAGTDDEPGNVEDFTSLFILQWDDVTSLNIDQVHKVIKYIDYEFISCEEKIDSSSFSDLLPLMMMGQNNMQTIAQWIFEFAGKYDDVEDEYFTISKVTGDDIRDVVADHETTLGSGDNELDVYSDDKFLADYHKCFDEATKEGGNKFDDLLPLMMMNGGFGGQGNGQMDPMMMMLMSDSDSDSSLLPFLMMQQGGMGGMGGMNGGQMDPMMMMLLLKDN